MENEKKDNPIEKKDNSDDKMKKELEEAEKKYYTQLYNDLPNEVVDILMKTHPLMGAELDPEAAAYRTRHTGAEEHISEVKKARNEQIAREIVQEQQISGHAIKSEQNPKMKQKESSSHKTAHVQNTIEEDDEEDLIQMVKMKPETGMKKSRQRPPQQNMKQQTSQQTIKKQKEEPKNSNHKKKADSPENSPAKQKQQKMREESLMRRKRDYSKEDTDFHRMEKEHNLDNLYSEEEYEEDDFLSMSGSKKAVLSCIVVGVVLFSFLVFKWVSLSGQLEKANAKIAENNDISVKYSDLQLEKMALEERLAKYELGETPEGNGDAQTPANETGEGQQTQTDTPEQSGEYDVYVAQEGDTYWIMSGKYYGNGAYYQRILDANGVLESDPVVLGKEYKIPKVQ